MMLINADALYEIFEREYKRTKGDTHSTFRECINYLCDAPTIDAVEVVRCGKCIYWQDNNSGYPHEECRWGHDETPDHDDYCSYGAKMEDKL